MHKRAGTGRSQLADAVYTAYYLFSTTKNKKRLRVTFFFHRHSSLRTSLLPVVSPPAIFTRLIIVVLLATSLHHTISLAARPTRLYRLTKGRLPKLPPDSFFVPSALPTAPLPPPRRRPRRARIAVLLPWVDATVPASQDRHRALTSPYPPRPDRRAGLTTSTPAAVTVASGSLAARLKSEAIILPASEATCGPPQVDIVRQPHTGTADLQSRGSTSRRTAAPGRLPNDAGPRTRNRLPAVARIGGPPLAADLCAISAHGRHRFARR